MKVTSPVCKQALADSLNYYYRRAEDDTNVIAVFKDVLQERRIRSTGWPPQEEV